MKRELVEDWMSREVITVTLDAPLSKLHNLMHDYKIRRIPVTQKGQLAGIVTLGDIRKAEPSDATSLSVWEVNYLISKLQAKDIMTRKPMTTGKPLILCSIINLVASPMVAFEDSIFPGHTVRLP